MNLETSTQILFTSNVVWGKPQLLGWPQLADSEEPTHMWVNCEQGATRISSPRLRRQLQQDVRG